ncbi:guanitoxin biosynthesis heme-dependent pre-guanitoxin N-hydroxylase GntA [Amycolatopsis japonica]|uniref:guanitoxin biosynthesis heme-dependent pre-guanitoxin N-hydroxylase GntA n=1 Tax=Amycolatopsis japonica TaxID=208439 RepID=UPI0037A9E332
MQPSTSQETHAARFREVISNATFPCLGAKAAIGSREVTYIDLGKIDAEAMDRLAANLSKFVATKSDPRSSFAVLAAAFGQVAVSTELEFEKLLWRILQGLHELDLAPWDCNYSSFPEHGDFKYSFSGRAFYVVGLHPAASRDARKFSCPTLVFNPVWQFQRLRERNQLNQLIEKIRRRDKQLQGTVNPNLRFEGIRSDAVQYSGRAVEEDWRCPFTPRGEE